MNSKITKFLIIANYSKSGAVEAANRVMEYIKGKGLDACLSISDDDIEDGLIREELIKEYFGSVIRKIVSVCPVNSRAFICAIWISYSKSAVARSPRTTASNPLLLT